MVSFETDIKPLFRSSDRTAMIPFGIDLFSYDDVKTNATTILDRLNSTDPTTVMPCDGQWPQSQIDTFQAWVDAGFPHFDPAPHSSFIISNRDTFSSSEVGVTTSYPDAFFVVYDGFQPQEVGTPTGSNPAIAFSDAQTGNPLTSMSAVNPVRSLEDPGGAPDVPQRITIAYDLHFTGSSEFPIASGGMRSVRMDVSLSYTGGPETTHASLLLVNQPNPYMVDVEGGNPYWLSVDTRVFQKKAGQSLAGITQQDVGGAHPHAANDFIQGVVGAFNNWSGGRTDPSHPFVAALSEDEEVSQLELARSVGGQRVYNYAVAKVRYRAPA